MRKTAIAQTTPRQARWAERIRIGDEHGDCAARTIHLDLLREAVPLANVLMPEFEQALRFVEDQLELYEIEENVRVHEANPEPRE